MYVRTTQFGQHGIHLGRSFFATSTSSSFLQMWETCEKKSLRDVGKRGLEWDLEEAALLQKAGKLLE